MCQDTNQNDVSSVTKSIADMNSVVNVITDREACSKCWYVAQVRSCCERKVANRLKDLGIETYVPLREEMRQWSDRKKKVSVVLIPMVVFLYVEPEKVIEIQKLSFIYGILKYPGQKYPAIIPLEQIQCLKFMVESSNGQVDFIPSKFKVGDNVIVLRGNLKGLSGIIKEDSNGKIRIGIILDLLGCATAEIPVSNLKLINQ